MSVMKSEKKLLSKAQAARVKAPILNRFIDFLSSVRFGVVLLVILVVLSVLGMIIIQQNVNGFEPYYAGLTPAQKTVYATLGFFDIYHSWYYLALLLLLSLNIVLASIDRFPSAWSYISRPKKTATRGWLSNREFSSSVNVGNEVDAEERIVSAFKESGLRAEIVESGGNKYVFAETGRWNRIGAYIVHVFLLTLFLGHFVSLTTGFDADVAFRPGQTRDTIERIEFDLDQQRRQQLRIPFSITATDIEQKLIDPQGSIETFNTIDWKTSLEIDDPAYGKITADVALNKPFHYRGYRFFQAQTIPVGNARFVTLSLFPEDGGEEKTVRIKRNGSETLDDGTLVKYDNFFADFTFNSSGQPDTRSKDYNNPAAMLTVTPKNGQPVRVFAFQGKVADNIPVGAPKAGYKWKLKEFQKSPEAHILSIKYDPYNGAFIAWYFGGIGLMGALVFVFFISHRRYWALLDGSEEGILIAGDTNRNEQAFEDKFNSLVERVENKVKN